jgi:hypothetical protein
MFLMLAKNSKRSENVRKPKQKHVKLAKLLSIKKQLNLAEPIWQLHFLTLLEKEARLLSMLVFKVWQEI